MTRWRTAIVLLIVGTIGVAQLLGGDREAEPPGPTVYRGQPTIHDGDNVRLEGENIRLIGIDACELGQPARVDGREIDCGVWARDRFRDLVGNQPIRCESRERDVYDRPLAVCFAGNQELNRTLVENGTVFLYPRGSPYEVERDAAQAAGRGVWKFEDVEHPSAYRG